MVAGNPDGLALACETFRQKCLAPRHGIRVTVHGLETSNQICVFLFCDAIPRREIFQGEGGGRLVLIRTVVNGSLFTA